MAADRHPNVDVMRRLYEAMQNGDFETLQELHDPDFRLSVAGGSPISGEFHGLEEAGQQFEQSMQLTGGQMELEVEHLLADDQRGIALITARAERPDGREIVQDLIHQIDFSNGKVTMLREWIWDQEADKLFWG